MHIRRLVRLLYQHPPPVALKNMTVPGISLQTCLVSSVISLAVGIDIDESMNVKLM